jgi:hypothetical protein
MSTSRRSTPPTCRWISTISRAPDRPHAAGGGDGCLEHLRDDGGRGPGGGRRPRRGRPLLRRCRASRSARRIDAGAWDVDAVVCSATSSSGRTSVRCGCDGNCWRNSSRTRCARRRLTGLGSSRRERRRSRSSPVTPPPSTTSRRWGPVPTDRRVVLRPSPRSGMGGDARSAIPRRIGREVGLYGRGSMDGRVSTFAIRVTGETPQVTVRRLAARGVYAWAGTTMPSNRCAGPGCWTTGAWCGSGSSTSTPRRRSIVCSKAPVRMSFDGLVTFIRSRDLDGSQEFYEAVSGWSSCSTRDRCRIFRVSGSGFWVCAG